MAGDQEPGVAAVRQVVGRYEILREIGRGGMAVVYVARQPDLDRQVALKELSRFHAGSVEYAHRFLRESRLAGSLNHPNVVTVHEYFEHDATPYIAMEYVPRGSLRPYMKRLTLSQIAGILEGVLAGLAHGEAAGIVHRDLKPENIMVTADGRVKITDFGIARATQRAATQYLTATGMTVGTPTYMAPEQAMAGDIGPWSDLYSLGVMTYELLVGRPPFHDSEAPMVILMRQVNERIPPPIEVRPDLDPALSAWVDSLLVKEPADRVRHAIDAWDSLEEIVVRLLGPLWRRNARLLDDQLAVVEAQPLTPAPFESQPSLRTPTPGSSVAVPEPSMPTPAPTQPAPAPASEQFVTFAPGRPLEPPAAPAAEPAPEAPAPSAKPEPVAAGEPAVAEPEPAVVDGPEPVVVSEEPQPALPGAGDAAFVTFAPAGRAVAEPPAPEPEAVEPEPAALVPEPEAVVPEPEAVVPEPEAVVPEPVALTEAPAAVTPEAQPAVAEPEPAPVIEPLAEPIAEPIAEPVPEPLAEREPEPPADEAPTPPARPAAPPRERGRGVPWQVPVAALGAVAAAAIGFLVAPGSHKPAPAPPALARTASAGPIAVRYPAAWRPASATPAQAAALKLSPGASLVADGAAGGGAFVFGMAPNVDARLLTPAFDASLRSAPTPTGVTLGSFTFKRYLYLQPSGAATPVSVYVMPTKSGTATAACVLPQSGAAAFSALCERVIKSMTLTAAPLPLTASTTYAKSLGAAVTRLNAARAVDGQRLRTAPTQARQAAAARALGQAYATAAGSVSKLSPPPPAAAAQAAIVAALRRLGGAYGALATAAQHNDRAGYRSAQSAITRDAAALQSAFARLQRDGFTIG